MYPETDVPVLEITSEHWDAIRNDLPLTTVEREGRLQGHGLSPNQIEALLNGELDDLLFEGMEGVLKLPGKAWASALLDFGTQKVSALAVAIHLLHSDWRRPLLRPFHKEAIVGKLGFHLLVGFAVAVMPAYHIIRAVVDC